MQKIGGSKWKYFVALGGIVVAGAAIGYASGDYMVTKENREVQVPIEDSETIVDYSTRGPVDADFSDITFGKYVPLDDGIKLYLERTLGGDVYVIYDHKTNDVGEEVRMLEIETDAMLSPKTLKKLEGFLETRYNENWGIASYHRSHTDKWGGIDEENGYFAGNFDIPTYFRETRNDTGNLVSDGNTFKAYDTYMVTRYETVTHDPQLRDEFAILGGGTAAVAGGGLLFGIYSRQKLNANTKTQNGQTEEPASGTAIPSNENTNTNAQGGQTEAPQVPKTGGEQATTPENGGHQNNPAENQKQ